MRYVRFVQIVLTKENQVKLYFFFNLIDNFKMSVNFQLQLTVQINYSTQVIKIHYFAHLFLA